MERMSIASFLSHGHDYHLYVYEPVAGVPEGATVRDASEILPRARAFRYTEGGSWSGFSNFFRYKLLLDRGGWWFDTDFVCLRRLDFPDEHVFASEFTLGRQMVTSGAIKAPAGSEVMRYAWNACEAKDPVKLVWGETGPTLMEKCVDRFSMSDCVREWSTFCPVGYRDWKDLIARRFDDRRIEASYTVHFWNEMWRSSGQNKDGLYPQSSLYDRLRREYLGETPPAFSGVRGAIARLLRGAR